VADVIESRAIGIWRKGGDDVAPQKQQARTGEKVGSASDGSDQGLKATKNEPEKRGK